jgi:hypothetical protein
MNSEQLLENFKLQKSQVTEEIRRLDDELVQKKELYLKLQGAIEGLELLVAQAEEATDAESE